MSTAATSESPASQAPPREIKIVSHSTLFYWWPVWAVGFIMAIVTLFSGQSMAVVPKGTEPQQKRELPWLKGEAKEKQKPDDYTRDVLVLPAGKHLAEDKSGTAEKPHLAITSSKNVGVLFCTILLVVVFITNVSLRGLWSVIVIGTIIFMSIIFALLGWWDHILTYLSFLDIRINLGGYVFISLILLILWAVITFWFDHRTYIVFTPGQFRVCLEIGEGETAYDTAGMTFEKKRNDFFRHWILGFGSGDLIVKTSGALAHTFNLPNVLFLGREYRRIEDMMRTRQVLTGQN
jgi:uncharacterized membrane protein